MINTLLRLQILLLLSPALILLIPDPLGDQHAHANALLHPVPVIDVHRVGVAPEGLPVAGQPVPVLLTAVAQGSSLLVVLAQFYLRQN